jgi:hypothetical protein
MDKHNLTIEINPIWQQIEKSREQCDGFLKGLNFTEENRDAVCMVLSELLENAVKYGIFQSTDEKIPINIQADPEYVFLSVKSPLGDRESNSERMKRLDFIIQWIRSYQAPFQAYLERLKLVAARDLTDDESGLGLVRIAYEGEAVVDFYVDENEDLTISAVYAIPKSK